MRTVFHLLAAVCCVALFSGADWLQFRGNNNTGVAENLGDAVLPLEFGRGENKDDPADDKNIAWQADLPGRGVSSPIVVGGKVIVTAASGFKQDRLHVLCFDGLTGKQLWERQFWATGRTLCHPTSSVAANTAASDGERIFAFFSSNDLACLDLEGNLLWFRGLTHDYPAAANDVGMASSPLVLGDTVIVQVETKGESFAAGLDTATGESRWHIDRQAEMNWTSPSVLRGEKREDDLVLLQSTARLSAHHPRTGEEVWGFETPGGGIPSAACLDGVAYVPSKGITALRHEGTGTGSSVLWESNALDPGNASPVVHDGEIYTVNRGGAMACGDLITGKVKWRLRLAGTFWATPAVAGNHLYVANQDGVVQVVRLGEKGEIVTTSDFGEPILGSPAVADGALFLRSDKHLWKVANK